MNVALIPVRGGSKSIPFKNIKIINGKPLVYWCAKAACKSKYIDKVFIATDSEIIWNTINNFKEGYESDLFKKLVIIGRSCKTATDTASTESAMLEFASNYDFNNIILIQATSPMIQSEDIDRGFKTFYEDNVDSVLSVVRQKRFQWYTDDLKYAHPINYDIYNRPRRQEFDGYLVENGAFYITSRDALIKSQNRISGNIKVIEMNEDSFLEIDETSDWLIVETLMKNRCVYSSPEIPKINMFLTDCDGCLTDGGMYYSESGDELKKYNTKDGMGFSFLKKRNIITGIITSEKLNLIERRSKKLDIDIIEMNCTNKLATIKRLCKQYNISLENVCYIGDDVNDIDAINAVGFGCCPYDASLEIKAVANYISKISGGNGVIRDVVNKILGSNLNR